MIKVKKICTNSVSEETKTSEKTKQRLALTVLQKQLQVLNLKESLLILSFISAGAFGRVLMQGIPSVEPITFFAILAGWMFGSKKGFITGASAVYMSNFFVFGGQGPWTIFQMAAFGIAGFFGGFLRKNATIFECFIVTLISTLLFEIIMNTSSVIFLPSSIFTAFFLGVPFLLVHAISNGLFSFLLPKLKRYVEKEGHFNEKEIYFKLIEELKKRKNDK